MMGRLSIARDGGMNGYHPSAILEESHMRGSYWSP